MWMTPRHLFLLTTYLLMAELNTKDTSKRHRKGLFTIHVDKTDRQHPYTALRVEQIFFSSESG